jgi:hypothetical protein
MTLNRRWALQWTCLATAGLILAGCGGGGGGAGGAGGAGTSGADGTAGGGAPPAATQPATPGGAVPGAPTAPVQEAPASSPALRFTPETVTATASAGTSATATVGASVLRPADFTGPVYAMVIDDTGVILPDARVLSVTATEYNAVVQTAPNLAPGKYAGNFTVKLCRDAGCAAQYPGSPVRLPYAFTVTPPRPNVLGATPATTLSVTVHLGAPPPPQAGIQVAGRGLGWQASSSVPWAKLTRASGTGDGSIAVDFDTAGLTEGKYEGTITVASADGQSVVLPVSLTMLATPVQAPLGGFLFFSHVNGDVLDEQQVRFHLESAVPVPFTMASDKPWVMPGPATGTTPAIATVAIDPARGNLASGEHHAQLTISSPYGKDFTMDVRLDLTRPVVSSSVPTLTLGGPYGRDFPAVPFTLSVYTRSNAWPWTLAGLPAWARASATSGAVSAAGSTVSVTPDETRAAVGSTTVMLTAQVKVNGDTINHGIPLTINRDQRKILPSTVGVAMVSTPGWSRLTRTVTVSDNFNQGAAWSAASDKSWLAVQRSGATLTLTADPATLPSNTTSYATVTLTPSDPGVEAPEKIHIGLWKGSANPAAMLKFDETYKRIAADPVRPLVYVHDEGGTIDVFNVYTGQKTGSVTVGDALGDMAVSPDGARLYVYRANLPGMAVVNLGTLALAAPLPAGAGGQLARILPIRPNGVEILVTSYGNYRAADGVRLGNVPVNYPEHVTNSVASQDGKRVYLNGYDVVSLAIDYSQTGNGSLFAARVDDPYRADLLRGASDVATNADGSRVYVTAGRRGCLDYDANLKPVGSLPAALGVSSNVEVDSFGRIYCSTENVESAADVWVFSPGAALLKSFRFLDRSVPGLRGNGVVVSGDGMMFVAVAAKPGMTIVAVGP